MSLMKLEWKLESGNGVGWKFLNNHKFFPLGKIKKKKQWNDYVQRLKYIYDDKRCIQWKKNTIKRKRVEEDIDENSEKHKRMMAGLRSSGRRNTNDNTNNNATKPSKKRPKRS